MSLELFPDIPLMVQYDPLLQLDKEVRYAIEKGATVGGSSYTAYSASSWSPGQFVFNPLLPNTLTSIVDPYILVRAKFDVTLAGTGPAGLNLWNPSAGTASIRSWPLNQVINTAQLQINNQNFSSTPNQFVQALQHYGLCNRETQFSISSSPTLPDNCQVYSDLANSSTNVLNNFQSSDYYQQGRGAFPITVNTNTNTAATLTFEIAEPIMLSPMQVTGGTWKGWRGISQLQLVLNLSPLGRMLSIDQAGSGITSCVVTVNGPPSLLMRTVTPDIAYTRIPPVIHYPYSIMNVQVSQGPGAKDPNAVFDMLSSNFLLATMPGTIWVWARRQDSDYQSANGCFYTDSFAEIQKVSISYNGNAGVLSSSTGQDLWRQSYIAGSNIDWPSWTTRGATGTGAPAPATSTGSVLVIKPYQHLGSQINQAPNTKDQLNFQLTLTVKNNSSVAVAYDLFIAYAYDGILDMSAALANQATKFVTLEDLAKIPSLESAPIEQTTALVGAGELMTGAKRFTEHVRTAIFVPIKKALAPYKPTTHHRVDDGNQELYGGKQMTRAELRRESSRR